MVTRFAWMAARFVSSKSETRYASDASCSAMTAEDWKRRSVYTKLSVDIREAKGDEAHTLKSCAISRTSRWKGSLRMRSSVDFWYRRISRSATVPGRKRWGFFTPPVAACAPQDKPKCQLSLLLLGG